MKTGFFYTFLTALLFFLSLNSSALDTKIELSLEGDNKTWSVGEIKDFKLTIYPLNDAVDEDIKRNLLSRDFADIIKISRINKQYFLPANPEYYIVEASGVLIATPKDSFPKIWDYRGMALGVSYSDISFKDSAVKQQDFFVFDKKLSKKTSILEYIVYILILCLLIGLAAYGFVLYSKKTKFKNDWNNKVMTFKSADTRDKHEKIYSEKQSYFDLFDNRESYKLYLNKINELQYKRNWTQEDHVTIVDLHDKAKENIVVK